MTPAPARSSGPDAAGLDELLHRLGQVGVDAALRGDADDHGWTSIAALAGDEDAVVAGLVRAGAPVHRPEASRFTATWFVGAVASGVALTTAATMLGRGSIVVGDPCSVHVPTPVGPTAARARPWAIRIDPGTERHPADATEVGEAVAATVAPLVASVHGVTGRGPRALWATVTDAVAAAFDQVGTAIGRGDAARTLATMVVDGSESLAGRTDYRELPWLEHGGVAHVRQVCCRWDSTPGGQLCATCPRRRP